MPHYSPLCDTNVEAYFLYLWFSGKHGSGVQFPLRVDGGVDINEGVCRHTFDGIGTSGLLGFILGEARRDRLALANDCSVGCRDDNVRFITGGDGCIDESGSSGLAVDSVDNSGSCVDGGLCDEFNPGCELSRSELLSDGKVALDNENQEEEKKKLGKNTERNRQWRKEKKEKKKQRRDSGVKRGCGPPKDEARISLEKKWQVENELAAARAERQLAILKASDLEDEVKRYRTKVKKHTESNMVAIEKTHATLVATGNVPGVVGFAETVVTDGSISPDSSASMQEFRACQKKNLDLEAKIEKMTNFLEKNGMSLALVEAADKQTFTDNTENGDLLDQLYPEGQGFHIVSRNGKNKLKIGCDVGEVSASFEPPAIEDDEYARRWVTQYSFIDAYAKFGSSDEDLCAEAEIGISVLRKYRRLKKQLNM